MLDIIDIFNHLGSTKLSYMLPPLVISEGGIVPTSMLPYMNQSTSPELPPPTFPINSSSNLQITGHALLQAVPVIKIELSTSS